MNPKQTITKIWTGYSYIDIYMLYKKRKTNFQFQVDHFKNSKTISEVYFHFIEPELINLEFHIVEELLKEKWHFPEATNLGDEETQILLTIQNLWYSLGPYYPGLHLEDASVKRMYCGLSWDESVSAKKCTLYRKLRVGSDKYTCKGQLYELVSLVTKLLV